MTSFVYFDTDCFHHFSSTFREHGLSDSLRDKIVLSPITMLEVFSHLARNWGDNVHHQLRGMHNWVNAHQILVLPWMDTMVSNVGFGIIKNDDHVSVLQSNLNACVESELSSLREIAKIRDRELRQIKQTYAEHFQHTVNFFKKNPLTEASFSGMWFAGMANRSGVAHDATKAAGLVAAFSALHEFEYNKLKVAVANDGYNASKHKNDLFDAEQLIYLSDPALHFLTLDGGYLAKILKSPQRGRIHQLSISLLNDASKVEEFLAQIGT